MGVNISIERLEHLMLAGISRRRPAGPSAIMGGDTGTPTDVRRAVHELADALTDMAERTGISVDERTGATLVLSRRDGERNASIHIDGFETTEGGTRYVVSALLHLDQGIVGINSMGIGGHRDLTGDGFDADRMAASIGEALGVARKPAAPPAGTYGPTGKRMRSWYDTICRRLADISERNLAGRVIEPDEEAYHIDADGYVTEEQMLEQFGTDMQLNRYIIMSCTYEADWDEWSLNWNNPDYWSDEAVGNAIENDDGLGCFWTSCSWEEEDYRQALEGN
ncbi:hypothetical protein [Bifidobacterium moukalabense]|uniref:hypothetical protein n=1 Tax=Bifidobacterium moukalabense TaxID=1333651 RepID=UPI0010F70FBA|nr:hypothetical protein [Bifidobacterium moukalabense]